MRKVFTTFVAPMLAATVSFTAPAFAQQAQSTGVAASYTKLMRCSDDGIGLNNLCVDANDPGGNPVTILHTAYKPSASGDLIIDVNLECMLFTEVKATRKGKNSEPSVSESEAGLLVWVIVDDDDMIGEANEIGLGHQVVGVTTDQAEPLKGKVRFCNRLVELEVGGGVMLEEEIEDEFVRLLISTTATHGFKWVYPNAAGVFGTNDLYVTLVGQLDLAGSGDSVSGVGFGKRLMHVENHHLWVQDEVFE